MMLDGATQFSQEIDCADNGTHNKLHYGKKTPGYIRKFKFF